MASKKGFTLVELLVVISIVGVLSAVIFSSLGGTKDKATFTAFRQHVDEFLKAVELARDSNGDAPKTTIIRYTYADGQLDDTDGWVQVYLTNFNNRFGNYITDFPRLWKPSTGAAYVYYRALTGSYYCGDRTADGVSYFIFIRGANSSQRSQINEVFGDWDKYASYPCKVLDE